MNQNVLKGILVLLVVVDHNEFSRNLFRGFLEGFSFHVVGFLMMPFLRPAAPWSRDYLNYLFRLYFPYLLVVTAMAIVVAWVEPVTAGEQALRWLHVLYSGNSALLKQVTDMALLWFLPAFISLVTLRMAIENSGRTGKAIAIVLLCVAHLFVGTVSREFAPYLPLGLLPAVYVVPLAYLGVLLQRRIFERIAPLAALLVTGTIYVAVKHAQIRAGLYNEIGFGMVADYRAPGALLINDLEAVTGVLMLFQLARFRLEGLLALAGKYSLQVYLFHAFVALGVYKVLLRFTAGWPVAALFTVSLLATVLLTVPLARFLAEQPLTRRFLFPRSPADLFGRPPAGRSRAPVIPSTATQSDARQ
ncbi:acyltransferase family protein [Massilia sp. BKSP1R2A-1]|uniref:acyltransferase family protein n=1 Tax=Massilia sp. BKSP1R2A-1 TaxID=3422595 RepID=UPI003D32B48D